MSKAKERNGCINYLAAPINMDPTGDIMIDGQNEGTVLGAWYPFA